MIELYVLTISQPKNIDTICKALLTDTAEEMAPDLIHQAEDLSWEFTRAFIIFAGCHNLYNSDRKLSDAADMDQPILRHTLSSQHILKRGSLAHARNISCMHDIQTLVKCYNR